MRKSVLGFTFFIALSGLSILRAQPAGWEQLQPNDPTLSKESPIAAIEHDFDYSAYKWLPKRKITYELDQYGFIKEEIKSDIDSGWPISMTIYSYTPQGDI